MNISFKFIITNLLNQINLFKVVYNGPLLINYLIYILTDINSIKIYNKVEVFIFRLYLNLFLIQFYLVKQYQKLLQ